MDIAEEHSITPEILEGPGHESARIADRGRAIIDAHDLKDGVDMPIAAFLSYSHRNRTLAQELKTALERFQIDAFLAHDDIHVSQQWRAVILKKLRNCELFIPVLTNAFAASDWTDQETGFALACNKVIVPLRVKINPHGFISGIQAIRLHRTDMEATCWATVKSLASHKRLGSEMRAGAISAFLANGSFDETTGNMSQLLSLQPFSKRELNDLVGGGARRQNIYGCFKAQGALERLIKEQRRVVEPKIAARFRKAVADWNSGR